VSFLRNAGAGSDGVDASASIRPRFSTAGESTPQPENLLNAVRPDEVREVPPIREQLAYERDARTLPAPPDKCVNVIAAGSRWKGSLNIADSVRIDGHLTGDVEAKGTVHISEGAQVDAKVKAAFVVICGSFKGEVRCTERLELLPKSKVQGDLVTKVLNVHEGATVDGSIRMSAEKIAEAKEGEAPKEAATNGSRSRPEA
jgi:cytoskeletal protein CcmA (bactofilin family)